jgi:hypothetical protein
LPRLGDAMDRVLSYYPTKFAEYLENRRELDAAEHLRAVKNRMSEEAKINLNQNGLSSAQGRALQAALDQASNFSFDSDPELSAAWRSAIEACFGNASIAAEITQCLKTVNPKALREFFLVFAPAQTSLTIPALSSSAKAELTRVGIFEHSDGIFTSKFFVRAASFVILVLMVWVQLLAIKHTNMIVLDAAPVVTRPGTPIAILVDFILSIYFPTVMLAMAFLAFRLFAKHSRMQSKSKLTETGEKLLQGFKKYYSKTTPKNDA